MDNIIDVLRTTREPELYLTELGAILVLPMALPRDHVHYPSEAREVALRQTHAAVGKLVNGHHHERHGGDGVIKLSEINLGEPG
jgi:hypothetical protein